MKIGVLIVCTGKYVKFFEPLYRSCQEFFMTDHDVTYYVFTEGEIPKEPKIRHVYQPVMGWPYDTLMRFEMFLKVKEELLNEDYLFFMNANMLCVDKVGEEILPKEEHSYLMAVQHPGFINRSIDDYTYERNPNSNFYIPYGKGQKYYQGNFNGGRSKEFVEMSEKLLELIKDDLSKGIIPVWWDESALNWYLLDKTPLATSVQYAAPQGWGIENPKIQNRNKGDYSLIRTFK